MTEYQVLRTHTSPYQAPDFLQKERELMGKIPGIRYVTAQEIDPKLPLILITNTHTQLKELAPSLLAKAKLIIHPNSGYDHFASEKEYWESIPLVVGHEVRAQAVAEYTLGALFEGLCEMPQHLHWQKGREWSRSLLKDQAMWIFGYGHIGKKVAATLASLGVQLTIVDPFETSPYHHLKRWQDGDLASARVVMSCLSLNQTSLHLFDEAFFREAHPQLLFINGARGKLVEEKALKSFLLTHPEASAFLDVFEQEPFGEEWHHFPQVWKTSHIAGVHQGLDQGILDFEIRVLKDFIQLESAAFEVKYQKELLQKKWRQGVLV